MFIFFLKTACLKTQGFLRFIQCIKLLKLRNESENRHICSSSTNLGHLRGSFSNILEVKEDVLGNLEMFYFMTTMICSGIMLTKYNSPTMLISTFQLVQQDQTQTTHLFNILLLHLPQVIRNILHCQLISMVRSQLSHIVQHRL